MERFHRLTARLPRRLADQIRARAAAQEEPTTRYLGRLIAHALLEEDAGDGHARIH